MVSILTKGGLTARFPTRIQSIAQNDSTNVMLIIDNEDLNYDRQKNGQHGCSNRFFSVPIQVLPKSVKKDIRISSVQFSHSVVSDSLRPHESQHARPPCPSDVHIGNYKLKASLFR